MMGIGGGMGGGVGGMDGGLPSMDGLDGMGGMDGSQGSMQVRVCMLTMQCTRTAICICAFLLHHTWNSYVEPFSTVYAVT